MYLRNSSSHDVRKSTFATPPVRFISLVFKTIVSHSIGPPGPSCLTRTVAVAALVGHGTRRTRAALETGFEPVLRRCQLTCEFTANRMRVRALSRGHVHSNRRTRHIVRAPRLGEKTHCGKRTARSRRASEFMVSEYDAARLRQNGLRA